MMLFASACQTAHESVNLLTLIDAVLEELAIEVEQGAGATSSNLHRRR